MSRKYGIIGILTGVCGIAGGILMVVAAFMEDAFPRPLGLVAAVCMLLNVIGIIMNYRYIRRQEKAEPPKEVQ